MQHEWLRETAKKFHTVYKPYVAQLKDDFESFTATDEISSDGVEAIQG